jgi:hypothetical protein
MIHLRKSSIRKLNNLCLNVLREALLLPNAWIVGKQEVTKFRYDCCRAFLVPWAPF